MKQAILILAFQNVQHLQQIVDYLDDNFSFYIHIDKKSKIEDKELDILRLNPKVKVLEKKYKVNWGGFNLTRAILYLAGQALNDDKVEYLHVISGSDFPIKNSDQINRLISDNKQKEHLENFSLPYQHWESGGLNRLEYFYLTDILNAQSSIGNKIINMLVTIQKVLKVKRSVKADFPKLYGGSTWWSLSADCFRSVFNYLHENPDYMSRFKFTWIADEFFFQTIIMNLSFADRVENNNLRMIIWESPDQPHPKVLTDVDYLKLSESSQLFARKFAPGESDSLLELLKGGNLKALSTTD